MKGVIRSAQPKDAIAISQLIKTLAESFRENPLSNDADQFIEIFNPAPILDLIDSEDMTYDVYEIDQQIMGVIAVKSETHLYHLFVDPDFQNKGIASTLWQHALARFSSKQLNSQPLPIMTVNASLNAVPIYQKFGFTATGDVVKTRGIQYLPMKFDI